MKHNRGGFLVAVLLLVIAVAVAGIVYYVLRITQTGPATATGGVEPTEPSSSAAPTGAPETDAPTETEAPTETTSPEELAAQEILDGMTLDEKLCQLFVVTPDALTGLSPATAAGDATREALERTPSAGWCISRRTSYRQSRSRRCCRPRRATARSRCCWAWMRRAGACRA